MPTIQAVAATVCGLLGVAPPHQCQVPRLSEVTKSARAAIGGRPARKILLYAPDAVGAHFLARNPQIERRFRAAAPVLVSLRSALPPKTPVCFATMFTGAAPEVHGIRRYERPILEMDTLFDALLRGGTKVAIVAVKNCSIDIIFRGRELDYFSELYDPEVTARTLELLEANRHDVVLAYHQAYDDTLHRTGPYSPEAVAAADRHAADFALLTEAAATFWRGFDHAVAALPDHGAHTVEGSPRGDHGEDIPEDMEITHFWGFARAQGQP